ncbi:MAG: hypothetical protein ACR2NN_18055 [Bryobacteraceae bacterium]
MESLIRLPEPKLEFRFHQAVEDPRDGLTLFGPLDKGKPYGIRAGVIGTQTGLDLFRRWVQHIQRPVFPPKPQAARPNFPGFEAAFGIQWDAESVIEIAVDVAEIRKYLYLDDKYQRVFGTVEVFSSRILETSSEDESKVDLWFVVIPDEIKKYCRPKSTVEASVRQRADIRIPSGYARRLQREPSLFEEENRAAIAYEYDVNFHNQLKARLLDDRIVTQIVRESVLANTSEYDGGGAILRSAIAWHISTAAFYKSGGRPWKVANVREGVCYVGLVFKQETRSDDARTACCAAQMFLDSGDGVVFKGNIGPWYSPKSGDFHLGREAAKSLTAQAVKAYCLHSEGHKPPKEMFLHGQTWFGEEEWAGFKDGVPAETNLVGVRIREDRDIKLYRCGQNPVLRGLAYMRSNESASLWTRGWIPRMQTYPGREVPNALSIEVCRGEADIHVVLRDIMSLTKLNFNACNFADGRPITLKFSNAVGEILTAGPYKKEPPLPFRHYV